MRIGAGPQLSAGQLLVSGVLLGGGCESRVQVSLFVRRGELCRFLSADGGLGPSQDCGRPVSLIAPTAEDGSWSLSLPWEQGPDLPKAKAVAVAETFPTG